MADPRVAASRAVLIEVMTLLAAEVDKLVVVGGWVPELLYPGRGHIGSLDVDLALDGRRIRVAAYDSIRRRLLDAGYRQVAPPHSIFSRDVAGTSVTVKLDLITGEGAVPRERESHEVIQEMLVGKLRGTDLALDHSVTMTCAGPLPDGAVNEVRLRIADVAAFVCMKAHALNERLRDKDAYDVYFCLRACAGGPAAVAERLRPLLGQPLVDEALDILEAKFAALGRVGPQWAARVAAAHGDDFDQVARDALERVGVLLETLGRRRR